MFSSRTSTWGLGPGVLMSLHCICYKMAALGRALCPRSERPHDMLHPRGHKVPMLPLLPPDDNRRKWKYSRCIMSAPRVLIYHLYGSIDCLLKYHVPNLSQLPADMQACEWKNRMLSAATLSHVNVATVLKGVEEMAGGLGRKAATESV